MPAAPRHSRILLDVNALHPGVPLCQQSGQAVPHIAVLQQHAAGHRHRSRLQAQLLHDRNDELAQGAGAFVRDGESGLIPKRTACDKIGARAAISFLFVR